MTIDYGIYLGVTSASIAKMEAGEPVILKSDTLKESIPLCVAFNKKGSVIVGDAASQSHRRDILSNLRYKESINSFIGFTRTIGTDKLYYSSNTDKSYSSEELLAGVIKQLRSFEKSKDIHAAVITIPASYKQNQIDAVRRAGKMAGLKQIEFIQEPIAAGLSFGLDSIKNHGYNVIFHLSSRFAVALLKDNILADFEDDNYLGTGNLVMAIIDEIIMPYVEDNYSIYSILEDEKRKQNFRNSLRFYAEETLKKLSSNEVHFILSDIGDIPGEDDNGDEFELDITVNQSDMETVLAPIFQKSIDICKTLLQRNNLKDSSLNSLILVGSPTFSPVLRKMLEEQICKPDTSVDPLTAIVKGAALYASTVSVSEEIKEQTRDKSKIQIEIGHEASSVEMEEFVTLKILADKTERAIPEKVLAEITRADKTWSSGRIEIDPVGEVIEVALIEMRKNRFEITLFNEQGNRLDCEPCGFEIEQGRMNMLNGLTLNWRIEKQDKRTGKVIFCTISGLEKNKSLPAVGSIPGIKTHKQIRPGMDSDFIKIPLYQGEHGADGTRAIYNEHVYDIIISGANLPALLPENSVMDLTITIDKSQKVAIQAYFPYLDYTAEIEVFTIVQTVETQWLANEIRKAKESIEELQDGGNNSPQLQKAEAEIEELEKKFENNRNDVDGKQEVLTNLRKTLKTIDELKETTEWPKLEEELKEEFYRLEKANKDLGNDKNTQIVNQLRQQLEEVIKTQDIKVGNALLEEINSIKVASQISYSLVEELLFKCTEDSLLTAKDFQIYFDQLYEMKSNPQQEVLIRIYKELKQYEK